MGSIRKLSPELVNQIAAGEVIERPASALKELVENAVDAGARRVEIALEDGGRRLIRVVDDGSGIAPEDLPLAVASHATSKIAALDDLFSVRTLGFRGEALASIGSVAELRVASRTAGEAGHEIEVRGGAASAVRPAGIARGTIVEVRNLFYNTPARRKFLRSGTGEFRACLEALTRLALGMPAVALRLVHDGRLALETGPAETRLARIADLFGREVAEDLVAVSGERGTVRLRGYAALPRRTRGDATQQLVTLDGRAIRDRLVSGAVREAYQGFLMTRRHPIVFLALEAEPGAVDVNVHPAKLEVRFREGREVFALVVRAIREALEGARLDPVLAPAVPSGPPARRGAAAFPIAQALPFAPFAAATSVAEPPPRYEAPPLSEPPPAGEPAQRASAGPPAHLQLASGYLVVETEGGFEVIDPHALHERILYEELKARIAAGALEVQALLVPAVVELSALEEARLEAAREPLASLGLLVEPFGPRTAAIQAVPAMLDRVGDWGALLRDLIEEGAEEGGSGSAGTSAAAAGGPVPARERLVDHLVATMACRAAVKLGERLRPDEVAALLERRAAAERSQLCPHGRPTALAFPASALERQFKR